MRFVHTRKKIFDNDNGWNIFSDKYGLLMWYLSALQIKKLGHTAVMYTDEETLEHMKSVHLDELYDIINTDVYKADYEGINFRDFWALPKIYAFMYELDNFDNTVMIDTDLILFKNLNYNNADVSVWANKEYKEIRGIYCDIKDVSLPVGYTFPDWFNAESQPLNTGILHFRNKQRAKEYCQEIIRFSQNNLNSKGNTQSQLMCFAEQRLLGAYIDGHKMTYMTVQPLNQGVFNKNGFHALVHKYDLFNYPNKKKDAILSMLLLIRDISPVFYAKISRMDLFKEERAELKTIDVDSLKTYKKFKDFL